MGFIPLVGDNLSRFKANLRHTLQQHFGIYPIIWSIVRDSGSNVVTRSGAWFVSVTQQVNPTLRPAGDDRTGNAVRGIRRMSHQGPIRETPPDDRNTDHSETSSDAEAGEISFDEVPFAGAARTDQAPFVHELQERAEKAGQEPSPKNAADGSVESIERWPPRIQALCIMGGSALCWAVILAPFLLF